MHFEHWICMMKQFWTTKSVMPDKAVSILMRHGLITDTTENLDGLFDYEYEMSLESTSSLATSSELRKSKDLELWGLIKDVDQLTDPETGTVYSIKKFKILMKLFEDYGWEPTNYIAENKPAPVVPNPADQTTPPGPGMNGMATGEVPATDPNQVPPTDPLAGNQMGSMLGNAMKQ